MEMEKQQQKQVVLKRYIIDDETPKETDMELKINIIDNTSRNYLVVKNLYLSCDPYMRGRMRDFHGSYIPPFLLGQALQGFGLSRVVYSNDPHFKIGDLVTGMTGWEEYSSFISAAHGLKKIQQHDYDIPLSFYVALLGILSCSLFIKFVSIFADMFFARPSLLLANKDNTESYTHI